MKVTQESESTSSEGLVAGMKRLGIEDKSFHLPSDQDTASTASSSVENGKHNPQTLKLNAFLEECNIEPLGGRNWIDWGEASERTRQRYVERASEVVKSVLSIVYPNNSEELWNEMRTSTAMNKLFGTAHPLTDIGYLEALSEAYKNATSWDTRRQVLSIMAGVASFKEILNHIPGLTHYRYTIANLHRLQYGRGAPLPVKYAPRLRIDRTKLDHFFSFITSPHLVHDLPFGEKNLKLSSGRIIVVPNVIRTMIPQRIVTQYQQYCSENDFESFSERTMLRILSQCRASVRKSLQGLDYFAAEGSRAFDDLSQVLESTLPLELLRTRLQVYKKLLKLENNI
ncbi:hypothetical protein QZH41_002239 [Actinostola sp. cb2023]|nr:hypothetical protein QZH41_002239 [Actinostola sp. cb2023]